MNKLQITIEKQDETTAIINLKGTLDSTNYFDLQKLLREFIDYKIEKIIINLSGLESISSAGAGTLIEAVTVIQMYHGIMALVAPPPKIKVTLDLLKVSEVCPIVNDVETALKVED